MPLRLAWFATAKGTSSRLLFHAAQRAIEQGELDVEIVCVVCNRTHGQSPNTDAFLEDVERTGTPLISSSSRAWRRRVGGALSVPQQPLAAWRTDFDADLLRQLQPYQPDAALLAGYMLVLTAALCDALPCLNLHPALPDGPVGTWQQVIHQLIAQRAQRSGMVLQRVTTELDRGPTVTWAQYPIVGSGFDSLWQEHGADAQTETPLFHTIRAAGASREPHFILQSLQALAEQGIDASGAGSGIEITESVEAAMARSANR